MLDETKRRELKATANEIRKWTLEMLQELSEGQFGTHIGGSLSIVDILTVSASFLRVIIAILYLRKLPEHRACIRQFYARRAMLSTMQ